MIWSTASVGDFLLSLMKVARVSPVYHQKLGLNLSYSLGGEVLHGGLFHFMSIDLGGLHTDGDELITLASVKELIREAEGLQGLVGAVAADCKLEVSSAVLRTKAELVLDYEHWAVGVDANVLHCRSQDRMVTRNKIRITCFLLLRAFAAVHSNDHQGSVRLLREDEHVFLGAELRVGLLPP